MFCKYLYLLFASRFYVLCLYLVHWLKFSIFKTAFHSGSLVKSILTYGLSTRMHVVSLRKIALDELEFLCDVSNSLFLICT